MSGLLGSLATEREAARVAERAPAPTTTPKPAREARPKRRSPWQQKELDELPDRIAAIEAEIAAVEAQIADPKLDAGSKEEIQRVQARRAELQASFDSLYAHWEELESL